jgi:hypothetical protein
MQTFEVFEAGVVERTEAARAYLFNLVEEGLEIYGAGEWKALIKSMVRSKTANTPEDGDADMR